MPITLSNKFSDKKKQNRESEASDSRLTVGLLGASFGTKNLGVAALTCGTVASVFHSNPNARLFLIDYAEEPATYMVKHPGGIAKADLVNIRFSKKIYLRNNIAYLLFLAFCFKLLPSHKWRNWLLRQNLVLNAIQEANIIGSIAGGDSFSDIYGLRRLIYVALPQILVLLLGKPLVLLPQTLGPFKGTLAKVVARFIVRHARIVYTRDPSGLEAVRELTGCDQGRLEFAYDMGFALEPNIRTERIPSWMTESDKSIPLVGLNVSGLLYIGGYTRRNMFGIKADYRRLMHDLIDFLIRKHCVHVMLVPHVIGAGVDSESDVTACHNIYIDAGDSLQGSLHLLEGEYDQHEIKALIGRCNFFIGSRMHACIAAISQCVPTVGLAYSRKFHGVFESVDMEESVIDVREFDEKSIIAAVDRAYQRRAELRAKLDSKIPTVRASVLGLFSLISQEKAVPKRGNQSY
jgi:polysaccharide pyruvyl transferase WcaK-like protein